LPVDKPAISQQFVEGVPILPGAPIMQRFKPAHALHGISVRMVDWGLTPSKYQISWRVDARTEGDVQQLGSGEFPAETIVDWGPIDLPISQAPATVADEVDVTLWTDAKSVTTRPVGVPLFLPSSADNDPAAEIGQTQAADRAQISLKVTYRK
jgi:hypothetical protein